MLISGLAKSSLIDYPGLISCVLFVPGCNYNCFYCHNRSLIDGTHDVIETGVVEDFLKKRLGLLDGVVITGGEPTMQSDLIPYMEMIKNLGYKIKLDTNGSSPQIIEQILKTGLCDLFAVDYKAPSAKYKEICGNNANAETVLNTIKILLEARIDFEVRTTVIPQLTESDLKCMANELPIIPRYVLNRYRPPVKFLPCDKDKIEKKPYTQSQIIEFVNTIRSIQPNTIT
mgnify:CR=1 FL=1